MSLTFTTNDPATLLKAFDAAIAQTEVKGRINTWKKTANGNYTHTSDQWKGKAYFKPAVIQGALRFTIFPPKDTQLGSYEYAYYHGHLTETFLYHFDAMFEEGLSTAQASHGDSVGG